jgi:hypothetical protein
VQYVREHDGVLVTAAARRLLVSRSLG